MKLWKTLQTGQLVEHKPDPFLVGFRFVQQAEYEHVDPYALQRTNRLALGRKRGHEDPTLACFGPIGCGPLSVASALGRQEPEALCYLTERGQHANSLRGPRAVDEVGDLCASDSIVNFHWVTHPS